MRRHSARRPLSPVPPGQAGRGRRPARACLAVEALEDRTVPSLLGQTLFPADNPWNQNIANAPIAANSTAIINNIISHQGSDARIHPDFGQDTQGSGNLYGIPYNVVHGNTTAKVNVVIDAYPGESDIQPAPIPANAVIEGDFQNGPNPGLANRGDSHLLVFDVDNDVAYEFYQASRPTENADGKWHANQETVWDMKTDSFRTLGWTSADAAGLSVLAGLVRPDEALPVSQGGQGVINHAIRFTLQNAEVLDQFIYPASHQANPGNTNAAVMPPMGTRFRLKASVNISTLDPESQVIARAMQQYGLILADNGSNFFFSGASFSVDTNNQFALTWNDNDIQDTAHGLKSLTFSDFEVVSLTPVVTGLSAQSGPAGTTVTVTGQNFSGAAGHLQVLFGNAPATSVTVLDDGHVTAVAPAGTGTVDVRVQSGVTTTADSSQNFTSPVFGYGTSATSAADKFTYTSGTAVTHFGISVPAGATAGGSFSLTLTALDANGLAVPGYTGTVHFTSSDPNAVLPANYTFTAADAGVHAFTATLKSAGSDSVTATDTATSSVGGSASVSVSPAAASTLAVAAPSSATAGSAFSVTVTAKDAFGNVATGYRGIIRFTSSDGQAALPANYTFTSTDNGAHAFSVTLKTAGSDSVSATDTATSSVGGSASVSVGPAAASVLVIGAPSSAAAGSAFSVTVTAKDAFGNVASGYRGTVRFASSDGQAALPANYTFVAADNGSHAFSVTLKTAGADSVSATDTTTSSVTGSASVSVSPAAATLALGASVTSTTAGTAFSVTLTAKDSFGNTLTGYRGTVHFSSSDGQASLPADYTFTAADNGSHAFSVTLKTAGNDTITAKDTATPSLTASTSVSVSPGAASALAVGAPPSATAGAAFSVTVTAKDAYGNVAAGYRGTVHFTSSDGQAALPANYTFVAADNGSHSFSVTLKTAGGDGVTATDTSTGSVTGTGSVTVSPGAAASLAISSSTTSATAGTAFTVTLKAKDAYGNVAAGYTGKVHFTSSDPAAALPADYTFTAADGGSHAFGVTLNTAGTQSVTAADTASSGLTATQSGIQVSASTGGTNVAPQGTAYRWYRMTSPTATTNQTKAPGLNDGNLSASVSLNGGAWERPNDYEAAGVVWSSARTINRVAFKNGPYNSTGDGVFDAKLALQFTTNGTTWQAAPGWALSPAYAYNSAAAGNVTYTFSGPAASVLGFRVVGQVYTATFSSYYEMVTEVQAFTPSGTASPAALTGGQGAGGAPALRFASLLLSARTGGSGTTASTGTLVGQGAPPASPPFVVTGLALAPVPAAPGSIGPYRVVFDLRVPGGSVSTLVGMGLTQDPAGWWW